MGEQRNNHPDVADRPQTLETIGCRRIFAGHQREGGGRAGCAPHEGGRRPVVRAVCGPGGLKIAVPLPACPPLGWLVLMQYAASRCSSSLCGARADFGGGRLMQFDAARGVSVGCSAGFESFSPVIARVGSLKTRRCLGSCGCPATALIQYAYFRNR